jgi:uncharacterized membrane protein
MRSRTELILNKGRLESFSDGVFAIAATLLVLELRLPSFQGPIAASQQVKDLVSIWPQYLVYFVSFATIGIMWLNHHALFKNVRRVTHAIALANLSLLSLISFLPFPTEVLGRYGLTSIAILYYGLTMTLISVAYNVLYQQVVAAHPGSKNRRTLWGIVGLTLYPLASLLGYFAPAAGLVGMGLLAIFYMQARNLRAAVLEVE